MFPVPWLRTKGSTLCSVVLIISFVDKCFGLCFHSTNQSYSCDQLFTLVTVKTFLFSLQMIYVRPTGSDRWIDGTAERQQCAANNFSTSFEMINDWYQHLKVPFIDNPGLYLFSDHTSIGTVVIAYIPLKQWRLTFRMGNCKLCLISELNLFHCLYVFQVTLNVG